MRAPPSRRELQLSLPFQGRRAGQLRIQQFPEEEEKKSDLNSVQKVGQSILHRTASQKITENNDEVLSLFPSLKRQERLKKNYKIERSKK